MNEDAFQSMSVDELWIIHETVSTLLAARIESKKRQLEDRLRKLNRTFVRARERRRPYPKVLPKFQNPVQPTQTWAGRGKKPRWLSEMIEAGKSLDDLRIRKTA